MFDKCTWLGRGYPHGRERVGWRGKSDVQFAAYRSDGQARLPPRPGAG